MNKLAKYGQEEVKKNTTRGVETVQYYLYLASLGQDPVQEGYAGLPDSLEQHC